MMLRNFAGGTSEPLGTLARRLVKVEMTLHVAGYTPLTREQPLTFNNIDEAYLRSTLGDITDLLNQEITP